MPGLPGRLEEARTRSSSRRERAVAPADVTTRLAVIASLYTLAAVAIVGVVLAWRRRHDRPSATVLIGLYALSYVVLLGLGR